MGSGKSSTRDLPDNQNRNHDGHGVDTEQEAGNDLNTTVFSPEPQTRQERARSTFSHSMEKSKRRRRRLNSSLATGAPIVDLPQQIAYHGANSHSKNKSETDHHGMKKNKSFDKKHSGNLRLGGDKEMTERALDTPMRPHTVKTGHRHHRDCLAWLASIRTVKLRKKNT